MSTLANGEPGPNAETPPALPRNSQFIALSDLAEHKLTSRDLLSLLPATIISIVFNTAFVIGLIWYNSGQAHGSQVKKVSTADEDTKVEARDKEEKDFIDLAAEDLASQLEVTAPTPGADPADAMQGIEPPPNAAAPEGVGQGKEGGVQGFGTIAAEGFSALPLEGKVGFAGDTGAGPKGDGAGLLGGLGAGSYQGGGFGYRTGNNLATAKRYGGNDASEAAVANGLQWLALHQSPEGKWSLNDYHKVHPSVCKCKDLNFEAGVGGNDTAGTAFGLLPFLGAGHHHRKMESPRRQNVFKALNYLIAKQDSKGDLKGGMYAHGLASIALCEAYAMSQDAKLRTAAQKAIDFIVYAQNDTTGGWHYNPKGVGDTSVVGWQVMALRSGQMAGLNVPSKTIEGARKWLDTVAKEGGTKYSYNKDTGATPAMTSAGLLNRQYLGWGPRNPELHKGCEYMLTVLPQAKPSANETLGPIYYYYYATQVMHHMEGKYFEKWNPLMRDKLIRLQEKEGHKAGSWAPNGADWGAPGGRMYTTSLAILTLEVYYRHMPLYKRAEEAAKDMGNLPNEGKNPGGALLEKKPGEKKEEKK